MFTIHPLREWFVQEYSETSCITACGVRVEENTAEPEPHFFIYSTCLVFRVFFSFRILSTILKTIIAVVGEKTMSLCL